MQDSRARGRPAPGVPPSGRPDDDGRREATARPVAVPAVRHLSIDEANDGQRLDNFLVAVCKGVPKSRLYRIVRSGELRVNGARAKPDQRLRVGDQARLPPLRLAEREAGPHRPAPLTLPVVFEDDAVLVVDKPAGLAVHGGSGVAAGVIERLRAARPDARFLELVHRIDRETSGLLIIAKRRPALVEMHAQMRDGQVDKRYRAIAAGDWPSHARTLEYPLHRYLTASGERRVMVAANGQSALTRVRGLDRARHPSLGAFSLVEAELGTGRTHQIRVHMAHAGAPLAGDDKYGDFELNRTLARSGFGRMFLHAHSLRFRHPLTGTPVRLEAALPADFEGFMDWARGDAGAGANDA